MTLPSTPNPGTALLDPLVTVEQYRRVTGDLASTEEDVTAELEQAQIDFCIEAKRTLLYGQYTENLFLYPLGMVYPSCTPIDNNEPITVNGNEMLYNPATDNGYGQGQSSIIQGAGVWVGYFSPLPWMPVWTGVVPPQTVITYSGGWQPWGTTGGPTAPLPGKIARILITIAYYGLNPSVVKAMGQNSVSMGGVSVAGDLSSFMRVDPNLKRLIRRFTRPQAYHWER